MNCRHLVSCLVVTVIAVSASLALAQRHGRPAAVPKPQAAPRYRQPCDFGDPRTRLEDLDSQIEKVIVRGSTTVGFLAGRNGTARVEAIELRDAGRANRAVGVVITLRETTQHETEQADNEIRSFVDYEEIDPLIRGLDNVAKTDDTVTKLANFETHYTTRGDWRLPASGRRRVAQSARQFRAATASASESSSHSRSWPNYAILFCRQKRDWTRSGDKAVNRDK